jgi:hypothetical protein
MFIPVTQKLGAKGEAVPTLWRDSAWRVRVFVRTRIGSQRPMRINPLLIGREVAGLPGLKIWNFGSANAPARVRLQSQTGTSLSARFGSAGRNPARGGLFIAKRAFPPTFCFSAARRKRVGIGSAATAPLKNKRRSRWSAACYKQGTPNGVSNIDAHRSLKLELLNLPRQRQTKRYSPLFSAAAERLRPVLAFASSQLGGVAASDLRIYSVFEYPLSS